VRPPRVKVSTLLFICKDIKIFLGEDEEDEAIDEEMEGLETEGDQVIGGKDEPLKISGERINTGNMQIRASSVIKNGDKFSHVPYQFTNQQEAKANGMEGFGGIVGTGVSVPGKRSQPGIENPK
jgi:hypothetical protein